MLFVCMAFAFAYVRVFRMFRYEFSQCTLNALFYMYVVESASLFRFGIDSKRFIFFRAAAQLIFFMFAFFRFCKLHIVDNIYTHARKLHTLFVYHIALSCSCV